jgi:hypothetical protein
MFPMLSLARDGWFLGATYAVVAEAVSIRVIR